ncbi:UvrD-helicase domain-containing protein [Pusillimonas sp. CC-YST705]|uniref:DNA 3'-5' helicase n=1 Tax=Mesopusillimonas faecipullorum TaxID=2755040 RepID=A0ABS8CB64_9BURK|nr:UvrD-helicase domain-containing protein [Mesopusillimonas faecipullorum]MCB5363258.1 UvrD-helicase domain-containing protein [Mesopusillimonas faecipullorum]
MTYRPPRDAAVRQQALDPTQSFLVQAPAGSGKTELLTDRILALLAIVDKPEQILAITFTRKAASEMHARVLSKLEAGCGPEPEAEHARASWRLARLVLERDQKLAWNLLDYPARLTIRTIDAFCAWLVRGMPWLSALGGLPAMTDSAEAHYQAAAKATLEMADEVPAVANLIAHLDVDMRATCDLIARMLAGRDQWLPLLDAHDAQMLIDNLNGAIAHDLEGLAQAMPMGWAQRIGKALAHAAQALQGSGDERLSALLGWEGSALGTDAASLPQWQALAHGLLNQKGDLRARLTVREGFDTKSPFKPIMMEWLQEQGNELRWVKALAAIRELPTHGYQEDQLAMLEDLVLVLRLAAAQLMLRFADEGEVDFIEVARRALQALGSEESPTDLLLSLDASIQHVLVDEFQDTSQSQIDLLVRLTAGWSQGDGRSLFLVGDPMQSIYRFRKAEVGWFLRIKENRALGRVALTPLVLTDNFRSRAGVVEWVNTVFKPLLPPKNDPDLGAICYAPSVPYHEALGEPSIHIRPTWAEPGEAPEAVRARTEACVASCVREALQRHEGAAHPVAILVRARSHLGEVVRALARHGIACRAVELVPLAQRQAVQDVLQLVRAMVHAGDRLAWLAVLRSPLCGLSLASLHALFGEAAMHGAVPDIMRKWLSSPATQRVSLPPGEERRLLHAGSALLDDANAAGRLPFATWLQQLWRRLGGEAVYPGEDDRADVEQLFRLLETLAPYGGVDLDELETRVARLFAASESAGPGVEVMTIHKAKGLQFETVILMGLHRRPANDHPPLLRFEQTGKRLLMGPIAHRASDEPDPVSRYLGKREKQRAAYEADRLLYVAVTRARQFLHLMAEVPITDTGAMKAPAPGSLLGSLWPYVQEQMPPPVAMASLSDTLAVAVPANRPLRRQALESLPPVVEALRMPTELSWQWQADAQQDEAVVGTVAHAWLERIGRDGLEAWPRERLADSLGLMVRQLSRAGVAGERAQAAAQIVLDTLFATLASERGRWLLRVAQASREWSLLDASGRVSVIDLAISDERGWLVVDYKTGVPRENEGPAQFEQRMRQRHGEQLLRYCAQVSALDGRSARGALYFPRADIWVTC